MEQETRRTRQRTVRSCFMVLVITKRGFSYKDPHVELTQQSQTLSYRGGFLCFDVEVTSNQLWHTHYSPYQSFLHNKIKQLKAEGLGYRKIAKRLNEENIKTSRGNAFYPSSVYSILKKKKIRDEEVNYFVFIHGLILPLFFEIV